MKQALRKDFHEAATPGCRDEQTLLVVKGMFPFRLGTTSYIIPDAAVPNIRFLGPSMDEIELLLFESKGEYSLPSPAEIGEMRHLAAEFDLVYNVHLPTDIFLGDPDPLVRNRSRQTILRFMDRTSHLDPTAFILHCESSDAEVRKNTDRDAWMGRVIESLEKLVRAGADPTRIALENIEYAPETIFAISEHLGMSLCIDIGHLLRYGHDLSGQLSRFIAASSMIHLHGVKNGRDHVGIQWIPEETWCAIYRTLEPGYTGSVSLEMFSLEELVSSLRVIADRNPVNVKGRAIPGPLP